MILELGDPAWLGLTTGFGRPVDVSSLLLNLQATLGTPAANDAWEEVWTTLLHQGTIGEASFAVVPHLVRIVLAQDAADWRVFSFVGGVELARSRGLNPDLPAWCSPDYEDALGRLCRHGCEDLMRSRDADWVVSVLGFLAVAMGARIQAELLLSRTDDELRELMGGA